MLKLHPDAVAELVAAVAWHEERQTGLGERLFQIVARRVLQADRLPKSGAPVAGFAARYDVRQFVVRPFRYVVITATVAGARTVVAIAHTSRRERYWRDRLIAR